MKLETNRNVIDYTDEEKQGIEIINKESGIKVVVFINDNGKLVCLDVKDKDDKYISYQELNI